MNKLYGRKTGLNGDGGWCHTEGESTWNSWTQNGDNTFFVIQRKGWEDIKAPDPKTVSSAFDDYGMSLIAILVEVETGYLLRETLRWNHKKAPSMGERYVDQAFEDNWEKLDKAVGLDVKSICYEHIAEVKQKLEQIKAGPNSFVQQQMRNATEIDAETIPAECRQHVTRVIIPDSVKSIGENAFADCGSLKSIVIPDSVKSIGKMAFSYCYSLTGITIPDSVKSIGSGAFYHCANLTSVSIPDSVESIGKSAFSWCLSLTSIVIPNFVTSIENGAFCDCSSLTSISIPDFVTSIGDYAFYGCQSLKSIVIPDTVKSIGEEAFSWCMRLTSITIPNSMTSIGEGAFCRCVSLSDITIPDSVKSIGNSAFYHCINLTSISIPDSVTRIEEGAFQNCKSLKSIVFKGKTLEEVKSMDFYPWGADTSKTEIIIQP